MQPKICFLDRATFAPHIQLRAPGCQHQWLEFDNTLPEQAVDRLQNVQIAIANKAKLHSEQLRKLPDLKLISLTATGYDNVDIDYCKKHNIAVTNIRDYAGTTISEHVIGLILMLSRNLHNYHNAVIEGQWSKSSQFCLFDYPIADLHESTLCIIGYGSLGKATAKLAKGLGMKVILAARKNASETPPDYTPFEQALAEADYISLHCPLHSDNQHMLGEKEFAIMKKKPIIINTARGGLIDSKALLKAIKTQTIRGAALDVLPAEPPPVDDPLLAEASSLENLIITPHVGWASDNAQYAAWNQAMENIEAFLQGKNLRRLV